MPKQKTVYFKDDVFDFLEKKGKVENRDFSNTVDTVCREQMKKENQDEQSSSNG